MHLALIRARKNAVIAVALSQREDNLISVFWPTSRSLCKALPMRLSRRCRRRAGDAALQPTRAADQLMDGWLGTIA